mmetsp:Transcript_10438/g.16372  ORF Transcript_10438/g.16372 Transcript_10438/m.16372 type:complete len:139 (-) Transcript_10438:229-645(-)
MKGLFQLLVALQLATFASSQGQSGGVKIEELRLSITSATHCDTIIEDSTFEGTCCPLNVTVGNGCVLNVVNGNCIIKGQYWTLDFTSTLKRGGVQCPPGEYDLSTTDFPTQSPLGAASSFSSLVAVSVALAGAVALVL